MRRLVLVATPPAPHLQSESAAVFVTDAAYESDSEVPQDGQRTSKVAIDLSVEGGEKGVGAVRPWEGAVVKPDDAPPNDGTQPDAQLELEWIYGSRNTPLYFSSVAVPIYCPLPSESGASSMQYVGF